MERTMIILNPWAGRGKAGRKRAALERALRAAGVEYDLVLTHLRGGAIELAWQSVDRGYTRIVAAGGDGTINEVANGIKGAEQKLGKRAKLGIIPLGTGSDFIKSLDGIKPNDIPGAVQRLQSGRPHKVDIGRVQVPRGAVRYFVNGLGIGLDAQVAFEALQIPRLRGTAVYLVAILRALMRYRAHPMTVQYDQHRVYRRLLFASVANGRCQGGGFWLTPDALVDDGQLDLCIIDHMRLPEIIRHLPKVMKGTHMRLSQVTMGRAHTVRVDSPVPIPIATDGEVIATDARQVLVETLPHGLEVLV